MTLNKDLCSSLVLISWLWTCNEDFKSRVSFHILVHDPFVAQFLKVRPIVLVDCDINVNDLEANLTSNNQQSHPYLINAARNVARVSALTPYVLASDVELYPSPNLAENFQKFVKRIDVPEKEVAYVVPSFEIDISERDRLPKSRKALVDLYHSGKVVYFHANTCKQCQKFPKLQRWIKVDIKPDSSGYDSSVNIFARVKREVPYHRWEPIFIGTNLEPLYDERLSWEGFQDKMTQMHELCLLGYNFAILDTAFLLHRPGIKKLPSKKDKSGEEWRLPFVSENSMVYQEIMQEMRTKYGNKTVCKEHS